MILTDEVVNLIAELFWQHLMSEKELIDFLKKVEEAREKRKCKKF